MAFTTTGELHGLDTKDVCELTRAGREYDYTVTASLKGTLRLKIRAKLVGGKPDGVPRWITVVKRVQIDGGQSKSGSFIVTPPVGQTSTQIKIIFSRGVGTKKVDYSFRMEPK